MAEIWDLVDKDGNSIGIQWERGNRANIPEGLYHPCVEVWVRVGDSVILTQRHPDKSEGLRYDSPGGAVLSGEDIIAGALRELFEESGIKAEREELKFLGAVTGKVTYAASFLLTLKKMPTLTLQPTEVVGYKVVSRSELENMSDQLCEGCYRRYLIFKDKIFG